MNSIKLSFIAVALIAFIGCSKKNPAMNEKVVLDIQNKFVDQRNLIDKTYALTIANPQSKQGNVKRAMASEIEIPNSETTTTDIIKMRKMIKRAYQE